MSPLNLYMEEGVAEIDAEDPCLDVWLFNVDLNVLKVVIGTTMQQLNSFNRWLRQTLYLLKLFSDSVTPDIVEEKVARESIR
ncbi:hypothetical protein QYM36_007054 [Artemia franciscana]|uniref:Uncharacterized protein n=1 Tax=Artemia franciscana TaxID=6661 RepID=A0AA88LCW3_ARTSF|nr:hypothetical protein QYM36_007054 [Artemia franciscana]